MNTMMISTADGSYRITFNHQDVDAKEAKRLYFESISKYGESVEMSQSAERLVSMDFDIEALKHFYATCDL